MENQLGIGQLWFLSWSSRCYDLYATNHRAQLGMAWWEKICVRSAGRSNSCWRHTYGARTELEILEGVVWEKTLDATKLVCFIDYGTVHLAIAQVDTVQGRKIMHIWRDRSHVHDMLLCNLLGGHVGELVLCIFQHLGDFPGPSEGKPCFINDTCCLVGVDATLG